MKNNSLHNLIELHEQVIVHDGGYWVKIEAWEVLQKDSTPHGIRYSLTLHSPKGERILGYDNAHAVKEKGKKYAVKRMAFDHRHRFTDDPGVVYEFISADQLLLDFFEEVDKVLIEELQNENR